MKRCEVERFVGRNVLIYAGDHEIYKGRFTRMKDENGKTIMVVTCRDQDRFLPLQNVYYFIENPLN